VWQVAGLTIPVSRTAPAEKHRPFGADGVPGDCLPGAEAPGYSNFALSGRVSGSIGTQARWRPGVDRSASIARWSPHLSFQEIPHPPISGREGGDLRKEGVWRIEAVGVVSSWS
jgi:hypothetical protein